jgi:hypothetical protein
MRLLAALCFRTIQFLPKDLTAPLRQTPLRQTRRIEHFALDLANQQGPGASSLAWPWGTR